MSSKKNTKNMSYDDELSFYDGADLDNDYVVEEEGMEEIEEEVVMTENDDVCDVCEEKKEEKKEEVYVSLKQLQDPKRLLYTRPNRLLPSVDEMNKEWEVYNTTMAKLEERREFIKREKSIELFSWLKIRSSPKKMIMTIEKFDQKLYDLMLVQKKFSASIIEYVERRENGKQNKVKSAAKRESAKKAAIARAVAKMGLNKLNVDKQVLITKEAAKKTLALDEKKTKEIKDAKAAKKAVKAKEIEKWVEQNKKLQAVPVSNIIVMSLDLPIESVEKTEEDKQAEKDEMNLILASINKSVVDKTEKEQDSLFSLEKKVVAEEKFTLVKNNKSSIKPKDISVGFKGLIAQSKENLYGQPRTFTPQQTSSSASSSARPTLYTQMCRSVISGKKCYHKECRFAHTYDQLCVCRFDSSCRLIAKVRDGGWFKNLPSRNTGKICTCKHSSECEASYLKRLNINQTPKR